MGLFTQNGLLRTTLLTSNGLFRSGLIDQGTTFSPTDIPDLALWLDASDASTITQNAGSVSQWNDKSGNARHATQGIGANQPVTGTRNINGLNAIDFDGSDDNLLVPATAFNYGGSTCVYVHLPDATTANMAVLNGNGNGGASTRFFFNSQELAIGNGARARSPLSSGFPILNVCRVDKTGSSTQRIIWDNEAELSNAIARVGIGDTFRVGSGGGGTASFYNGAISEVFFFQREITNAEVNSLCNYLAAKWGTPWTNV